MSLELMKGGANLLEIAPVNLNAHVIIGPAIGWVTKAVPATCTGPVRLVPVAGFRADIDVKPAAKVIDGQLLNILGKIFECEINNSQ